MTIEQLSDPAVIAILALFGLAFVRFGVWWAMLRPLVALLLRPASLLVIATTVGAVMKFA